MDIARDAYVAGSWHHTRHRFAVRDPFDGAHVADVVDADDALVAAAITAAVHAFPAWRQLTAGERGKLLAKLALRMVDDEARLAELCTRENGKPLQEAAAEVRYAASFLAWFAGEAER